MHRFCQRVVCRFIQQQRQTYLNMRYDKAECNFSAVKVKKLIYFFIGIDQLVAIDSQIKIKVSTMACCTEGTPYQFQLNNAGGEKNISYKPTEIKSPSIRTKQPNNTNNTQNNSLTLRQAHHLNNHKVNRLLY